MAQLTELQKMVLAQTKALRHSEDPNIILLFLMEELGEVTRAYLKESGHKESNNRITESFKQELGDVTLLLLRLAAVTDTDLEAMLTRTMKKLDGVDPEEL